VGGELHIGQFNNGGMQGTLNNQKLRSYEVRKFGELSACTDLQLIQVSKLLNFPTSLIIKGR
jgi:hypothetical protein